jgi:DNA repair exonuclease SbcCD ATPase subunit
MNLNKKNNWLLKLNIDENNEYLSEEDDVDDKYLNKKNNWLLKLNIDENNEYLSEEDDIDNKYLSKKVNINKKSKSNNINLLTNKKNKYDDIDINILQNKNKKIKYVVHLADIHIKKRERNDEFRSVFEKLEKNLKEKNLNSDNTVIVVAGDIIDNGVDLHPQSVKLTKDFVIMLASIADVVLISGNHDLAASNDQYNGLLSIVQNLKTINEVYLLIDQGVYEYNNILFGHTKFGDNQFVQPCNIKTDKIKCGLYHGTLHGSKIESGIEFKNEGVNKYLTIGDFKDYDYTFLGDIHKMSFLTNRIAYSGSLIQMDSSESLEKGYILWDFEKAIGEFVKIKSDYGKVKISIDEKGKTNINVESLPKYLDVDIECQSMNRKHIDDLYSKITLGNIILGKKNDRMKFDQNIFDTKLEIKGKQQDMILIKNKEDVIKLLISKLDDKLDNTIVDELKLILNESLKTYEFVEVSNKKNIKLISFKFDNMAIFGSNNSIDFLKLNGIIGLSGENSIGKSSFVDTILQSIFGSCTRGTKFDMININSNSFKSEIILDVNGIQYKICRVVNRNTSKKNNNTDSEAKEKLILYENEKNITEKNIKKTQNLIIQKIGDIFEFITSCFVTQKSISQGKCVGFAELDGKERKNTLCKIARLDVYEYLSKIYSTAFLSSTQEIGKYKGLLNSYNYFGTNKDDIKTNIMKKNNELEMFLNEQLENVSNNVILLNDIQKNITIVEIEIKNLKEKICEIVDNNKDIKNYENENIDYIIDNLYKKNKINEKKLEIKINEKNKLTNLLNEIGDIQEIEKEFNLNNKTQILLLRDKIKEKRKLIINNFDVDCCKYNENSVIKNLDNVEIEISKIDNKISNTHNEIKKNSMNVNKNVVEVKKDKVDKFNNKKYELQKINDKLSDCELELIKCTNLHNSLKNHEYDEKCEYCMKNTITKEKRCLEIIIKKHGDDIILLKTQKKTLDLYCEKNKLIVNKYDEYVLYLEDKKNMEQHNIFLNKDLELFISKKEILENKKKDLIIQKTNYYKYVENNKINNKINDEIDILENEIDTIDNSICDDVVCYNDLMKQTKNIDDDINNINIIIEKNMIEFEKQKSIKIICENNKDLFLKLKKMENDKIDLEKKYEIFIEEFDELTQKICDINETINKTRNEISELKHKNSLFTELYNNIVNVEKKKDNYNILTQLLKNDGGGIIDILIMKNLLPKFNEIVNVLFSQFGEGDVKITYEKSEIKIRDDFGVDIVKNGGYKAYLNNLVYRIAISQLSAYMSTDFMIIDEVCDSADVDNKANIKKLIDYLKSKNKWVLIISHDDDVKDKFEKRLVIKTNKNISRSHKIEAI